MLGKSTEQMIKLDVNASIYKEKFGVYEKIGEQGSPKSLWGSSDFIGWSCARYASSSL